jgi:hypothetical protein
MNFLWKQASGIEKQIGGMPGIRIFPKKAVLSSEKIIMLSRNVRKSFAASHSKENDSPVR